MRKIIRRPVLVKWEPFSGVSHMFGALASLPALVIITYLSTKYGTITHVVANAVFVSSMMFLYTASASYHILPLREEVKEILQRIDHAMIYVMIAGTYTPICMIALRKDVGLIMLYAMWGLAIIGIGIKIGRVPLPQWLSVAIYVFMGWIGALQANQLYISLKGPGFAWLVGGGMSYMFGVYFFLREDMHDLESNTLWRKIIKVFFLIRKKPIDHDKEVWDHEIFHILVLTGSFCHYWVMIKYVLYLQ